MNQAIEPDIVKSAITQPNLAEVEQHIHQWIRESLSVPSPHFNNFPPCPYSLNALVKNKLDIQCSRGTELLNQINEIGRTWDDSYEMVMVVCDRQSITPDELIAGTESFNAAFKACDLMSNFDHPDNTHPRYKVTATNGKYALAIVQRLENFVQAAKPLFERGYFKNVNPEVLTDYPSYKGNFATTVGQKDTPRPMELYV